MLLPFLTPEILLTIFVVAVFVIYWIDAFILLYHMTRFGVGTQPKRFAAVFLLGSVFFFTATILAYSNVDFNSISIKW